MISCIILYLSHHELILPMIIIAGNNFEPITVQYTMSVGTMLKTVLVVVRHRYFFVKAFRSFVNKNIEVSKHFNHS